MKQIIANLDVWGCTTSLLCAIHCAVLPIFLSMGLLGSHHWMAHPILEIFIILISMIFIYNSIIKDFLRTRANSMALTSVVFGLAFIAMHHMVELYSTPMVVTGGLLVTTGHILNMSVHRSVHHA